MGTKGVASALDRLLKATSDVEFADGLMELINCTSDTDYATLVPELRLAVALNSFSLEVTSGGLYQLLANTDPGVLRDIRSGLEAVGANETAQVLGGFIDMAFGQEVPDDPATRCQLLDDFEGRIGTREFKTLGSAVGSAGELVLACLRQFVSEHRVEIAVAVESRSG